MSRIFDLAFGEVFAQWRERLGATQDAVARCARSQLLDWKAVTVAQLESGRRHWQPFELVVSPLILEETREFVGSTVATPSLPDLLREMGDRGEALALLAEGKKPRGVRNAIAHGNVFPTWVWIIGEAPGAEPSMTAHRMYDERHAVQQATAGEAERKVARVLGVTTEDIAAAASALWGRTLTDQREHLLQPYLRDKSVSYSTAGVFVLRGHITRGLTQELRTQLTKTHTRSARTSKRPEGTV